MVGSEEPIAEFAEAFGVITKDCVAGKSGAPLVLRDWQRSLLEHMFAFENGRLSSPVATSSDA